LEHAGAGPVVEVVHVCPPEPDHDRPGHLVAGGVPPVVDELLPQVVGSVGSDYPAVLAVAVECGGGVAVAEFVERRLFPLMGLAAVVGELDRGEAGGQRAVQTPGVDLRRGSPTSTTFTWRWSAWWRRRASCRVPTIPASSTTSTDPAGSTSSLPCARRVSRAAMVVESMPADCCSSSAARAASATPATGMPACCPRPGLPAAQARRAQDQRRSDAGAQAPALRCDLPPPTRRPTST
jgi:hypothetical protein